MVCGKMTKLLNFIKNNISRIRNAKDKPLELKKVEKEFSDIENGKEKCTK